MRSRVLIIAIGILIFLSVLAITLSLVFIERNLINRAIVMTVIGLLASVSATVTSYFYIKFRLLGK